MSKVTVDYMGVEGAGRTMKEAKENAAREVRARLEGDYAPFMLQTDGHTLLVWRTPLHGWTYQIYDAPHTGRVDVCQMGCGTKEETIRRARKHLAQNLYQDADRNGAHVVVDEADLRDHMEWVRWQEAYKAHKAKGMTDQQAFDLASGRPVTA